LGWAVESWEFADSVENPTTDDYKAFIKDNIADSDSWKAILHHKYTDIVQRHTGTSYDVFLDWAMGVLELWIKCRLKSARKTNR
jgi:hypothetical protein